MFQLCKVLYSAAKAGPLLCAAGLLPQLVRGTVHLAVVPGGFTGDRTLVAGGGHGWEGDECGMLGDKPGWGKGVDSVAVAHTRSCALFFGLLHSLAPLQLAPVKQLAKVQEDP